jgi:CDP-6-deoxy-D-xylo-4-hexulose-3-dehydrase
MRKYRKEIAGVFLAHTLGFPFDEKRVSEIIEDKFFITDNCDAIGCMLDKDTPVGHYADASTYSFFPAHHISTVEGGAITTYNRELGRIMNSYVNWGRDCYCLPGNSNTCGKRFSHIWEKLPDGWDHKYIFSRVGYNLKMTELQAALGLSQLSRIEDIIHKRRKNFFYLSSTLGDRYDYLLFPKFNFMNVSPFGCPILINKNAPFTANELIAHLESNNISTRRVFAGNITRQPGYQDLPYISVDMKESDYVMENMFWIGCQDKLAGEQLVYVKDKIIEFMERYI